MRLEADEPLIVREVAEVPQAEVIKSPVVGTGVTSREREADGTALIE